MVALKCLYYLCLWMAATIHAYSIGQADKRDTIFSVAEETSKEDIRSVEVRVTQEYTDLNEDNGINNPNYTDTIYLNADGDVITADDEPIVISTTTYVCSTIGFLCIFVALVYWKYRYYTLYYGKTWGDDDSIDSRVMKVQADPTAVIQAGDYLLIT